MDPLLTIGYDDDRFETTINNQAAGHPMLQEYTSSQDFICEIVKDVQAGHGFVPMIGSGMSAPSGILMGMQFMNFLSHAVFQTVEKRWRLREHGWPRIPDAADVATTRNWVDRQFATTCESHGYKVDRDIDGYVSGIRLKDSATPADVVRALNRPLIPYVIRASTAYESEEVTKQLLKLFQSPSGDHEFVGQPSYSPTSQAFIREKAIRSLHEWRSTLQFLATIDVEAKTGLLRLREADPAVIDSFNSHITRDKRSNLSHKMLAHLSRPLRIRTILTTNFDTLIEDAFSQLFLPLKVLPVSVKGSLPDAKTVRAQNCIIKLHGELLETRADYSLDDEPSHADKESFSRYVRGGFDGTEKTVPISNHLIVVGYSASDIRCVQMIKYLLDEHPDVKIYWICFNTQDVSKINQTFGEKDYEDKFRLHTTNRSDLLLYELYQELTLCLPAGGFAYEFTHKVPPEPQEAIAATSKQIDIVRHRLFVDHQTVEDAVFGQDGAQHRDINKVLIARSAIASQMSNVIIDRLLWAKEVPNNHRHGSLYDLSDADETNSNNIHGANLAVSLPTGAAQAMRQAFRELVRNGKKCIWLELQDYSNVVSLAQEILRIIALRIGSYQLEHVVLFPIGHRKLNEIVQNGESPAFGDVVRHLERLEQFLQIKANNWFLFLYGRGLPGACSGWESDCWQERDYKQLKVLSKLLRTVGFNIIYMPLTLDRCERDTNKVKMVLAVANDFENQFALSEEDSHNSEWNSFCDASGDNAVAPEHADTVFVNDLPTSQPTSPKLWMYGSLIHEVVKSWIQPKSAKKLEYSQRLKFLYSTTLFRQSRHTSAFFSDAVFSCPFRFNIRGVDNDWYRSQSVRVWVRELRKQRVFYHKPGGYCWKHRDVRLGLQAILESIRFYRTRLGESGDLQLPLDFIGQMRARSHFWIGDWYFKAFTATGHSMPVLESLYHRFESARFAVHAKPSKLDYSSKELATYRFVLFRSAVMEMIKTIRAARPWMKFWLSSVEGHPMFAEPTAVTNKLKAALAACTKWYDESDPQISIPWASIGGLFPVLEVEITSMQHSLCAESGTDLGKTWTPPQFPKGAATAPKDVDGADEAGEGDHTDITLADDKVGGDNWKSDFIRWLDALDASFIDACLEMRMNDGQSRQSVIDKLNEAKMEWLAGHVENDLEVYRLLDIVSDFAYLHVKRARMESRARGKKTLPVRERWCQVTVLCFLGLEFCRHLHPAFWLDEVRLKVKLHTIYGLALSHLDRFFEAHRHINEATALLSKTSSNYAHNEFAIIRLRRTEIYLAEAEQIQEIFQQVAKVRNAQLGNQTAKQWKEALGEQLEQIGMTLSYDNAVLDDANELFSAEGESTLIKRTRYFAISALSAMKSEIANCNATMTEIESILDAWKCSRREKTMISKLDMPATVGHSHYAFNHTEFRNSLDDAIERIALRCSEKLVQIARGSDNSTEIFKTKVRNSRSLGCLSQAEGFLEAVTEPRLVCVHPSIRVAIDREESIDQLVQRLDRLHCATLDDAWVALESAERLFSGRSHSSLWWGRLALLKLRAYASYSAEAKFESLVFRKKVEHDDVVRRSLDRGVLMSPNGLYRKLCFFDSVTKAIEALTLAYGRGITSRASASSDVYESLRALGDVIKSDINQSGSQNISPLVHEYSQSLFSKPNERSSLE